MKKKLFLTLIFTVITLFLAWYLWQEHAKRTLWNEQKENATNTSLQEA